jgi:hypothetical protein
MVFELIAENSNPRARVSLSWEVATNKMTHLNLPSSVFHLSIAPFLTIPLIFRLRLKSQWIEKKLGDKMGIPTDVIFRQPGQKI